MPRLALALVWLVVACGTARSADAPDLYRAETIVTGTGEAERIRGFREGLREVIVKLTGDPRLFGDRRLDETLRDPQRWVADFELEDRMKGIPVHDEQGTRERPHFLRMRFEAARLDAELGRLGLSKWADRPPIAVWLGVRTGAASYLLSASGPEGYGQRVSLLRSAERRGLQVTLPPERSTEVSIALEDVAADDLSRLEAASEPGSAILSGLLSIAEGGRWDIRWRLVHRGRSRAWSKMGISFDVALLDGLDTAALTLSGNLPF